MIEVISPGLFTSIQDQGRFGYRHLGVPVAGTMDQFSAELANALLNNTADMAVLEMTIIGAILKFHSDCYIVVSGAKCAVKQNSVISVKKGETINFGRIVNGSYIYVAVAGGLRSEKKLGSRSFYLGITSKINLNKGDHIRLNSIESTIVNRAVVKGCKKQTNISQIEVFKGPEFDFLEKNIQQVLLKQRFKVSSQSNRMAIKLEHSNSLIKAPEVITSAVQPGTIQITPSGELIALMRDCQTTGGYARVLQLTKQSINQLAQIQFGKTFIFSNPKS